MGSRITNESHDNKKSYFQGMSNLYNSGVIDVRIKNILIPIEDYLIDNIKVLDVGTGVGTFAIEVSSKLGHTFLAKWSGPCVNLPGTSLKLNRQRLKCFIK